jgi:hypothetical protein
MDDGGMRVVVAAVVTMSVAQLLDLATFDLMVRELGARSEANPLVGALFGAYGLRVVAIAKVALLALVTAVVAIVAGSPARRMQAAIIGVVLAVAIVAGVVGSAANTAAVGLI